MPHHLPTLDYPEVQAHLAKLKAEHRRTLRGLPAAPRHPAPPPPEPAKPLTLSIPLTPDVIRAIKAASGQHAQQQINAAIALAKGE